MKETPEKNGSCLVCKSKEWVSHAALGTDLLAAWETEWKMECRFHQSVLYLLALIISAEVYSQCVGIYRFFFFFSESGITHRGEKNSSYRGLIVAFSAS